MYGQLHHLEPLRRLTLVCAADTLLYCISWAPGWPDRTRTTVLRNMQSNCNSQKCTCVENFLLTTLKVPVHLLVTTSQIPNSKPPTRVGHIGMQSAMLEDDMRGCTEGKSGFVEVTTLIGCEGFGVPVKKIGSFRAFFWWHSNHHGEEHVCHWLE